MPNRYDISGLVEAQFEPGSHRRVLKNLLGIKSKREMDRVEAEEYLRALEEVSDIYDKDYRFIASDVCRIHKIWLENIYEWAGCYRNVNVSKDCFIFAAARQIPRLMDEFEKGPLREFTPCRLRSNEELVKGIAVVHTELMLIHPFREGNGRTGRMLASLMALQAGLPSLDFGGIKGRKRHEYFAAVRAGLDKNYTPMEKIFTSVVQRTLRSCGGQV